MPETTLTFNINPDIPAGKVNTSSLEATILEDPQIETALKECVASGNELKVTFNAAPTAQTVTALSNDTSAPCGGILGAHLGNPPAEAPTGPNGEPIVSTTFADAHGLDPEWQGWRYQPTASDGATPLLSVFDEAITVEKGIRSGSYRIIPPGSGAVPTDDVIEFSVIDKDDLLGLFTPLGLTLGVDVLELKKWVVNEFVDGNARNERLFSGQEVFAIMAGLYLRTGYTSNGTAVPTVLVTVKDYME